MRTSVTDRNDMLQGRGTRLDNGFVRFYDGISPTDPDTALSGNALIAECALSNPACQAAAGGQMAFNVIVAGVVAANGSPTFARFFRADGVTAVVDMDVPEEIVLSKSDWVLGEPFPGPSILWSAPVEC